MFGGQSDHGGEKEVTAGTKLQDAIDNRSISIRLEVACGGKAPAGKKIDG